MAEKVTYKGKQYLQQWVGQTKYGRRAKLSFLDGSKEFWVDASLVSKGAPAARSSGKRRFGGGGSRRSEKACRAAGPGEISIHRKGYDNEYEEGEVLHATKITGGGGSDGHYFVVVACGRHRISEFDDDCREGEWQCDAVVRPATFEEAAPREVEVRQAASAKFTKQSAVAALTNGTPMGRTEPKSVETLAYEQGTSNMSALSNGWICVDAEGVCYYGRPVYDDSPFYTRLAGNRDEVLGLVKLAGFKLAAKASV